MLGLLAPDFVECGLGGAKCGGYPEILLECGLGPGIDIIGLWGNERRVVLERV